MELDYSVSWNEVKSLVDKLIENHDEKMAMGDIDRAVTHAWEILFDGLDKKYGVSYDENGIMKKST